MIGLILFISFNILLNITNEIAISKPIPSNKTTEIKKANKTDCFSIISQADELYLQGNLKASKDLYRQCKPSLSKVSSTLPEPPKPVYDIKELDGGQRLWEGALAGKEKNLEAGVYFNLVILINSQPQFIPAYIELANFCLNKPNFCKQSAREKEGDPKNASEVLARATALYPNDAQLVKTQIKLLHESGQYLDASITARQFAQVFPNSAEAPEFAKIAEEDLNKFEEELQKEINTKLITAGIISVSKGVLFKDPNQGINTLQILQLMSQGESAFGSQIAESYVNQYQQQGKLLDDPESLDYIKELTGKLTTLMGRNFNYEYHIVKDKRINAFALPGGKVFVNTGIILGTNSGAELAGVLGHEISHAVFSHGFQKVSQSFLLNQVNTTVNVGQVFNLINAQYGQGQERQSDIFGTNVLSRSGYAADGLLNVMFTFKKLDNSTQTNWFASHPAPVERVQYLEKMIKDNSYNIYAYEGLKKHREIQERIKKLSNS